MPSATKSPVRWSRRMRSAVVEPVAIPHARAGVEQDHVLVGIHGGFGGAGLAVAFFVGEVAGLLHGGQLAGLGVEARLQCRGWWWCWRGRLRRRSSAVGSVRVLTLVARKLSTRFCGP